MGRIGNNSGGADVNVLPKLCDNHFITEKKSKISSTFFRSYKIKSNFSQNLPVWFKYKHSQNFFYSTLKYMHFENYL